MNRSFVIFAVSLALLMMLVSQAAAAVGGYYSGSIPVADADGQNPALEIAAYTSYIQNTQQDVSDTVATAIATEAYWEARNAGIQPSLVLAIMQIESTFRVNARNAGCYGLLQVNYKAHRKHIWRVERQEGVKTMLNPRVNIRVGVGILRACLDAANGNVTRGLLRYNGAVRWNTYPLKVLAAQKRIHNYMIAYGYVEYQPASATA